jgi:hypothetical protein
MLVICGSIIHRHRLIERLDFSGAVGADRRTGLS